MGQGAAKGLVGQIACGPVHALEIINLDVEVEEQAWAIWMPGRCFTKAQNS